MRIDNEVLQSYLDNELNSAERKQVEAYLATSIAGQAQLQELQAGRIRATRALQALAPSLLDKPDSRRAFQRLQQELTGKKEFTMLSTLKSSKRAQRIAAGVLGLLVVIGLFMLAPVQALAHDFLSIFRIEQFLAVEVDSERMEEIFDALNEDGILGEQEVLHEMEAPTEVASLDEAASLLDFPVRTPAILGEPSSVAVSGGSKVRFTPSLAEMQLVFTTLDLDPEILPASIDGQPFDITVSNGVDLIYEDYNGSGVNVMVMRSPVVETPDGVDVEALGNAMLQLMGMSPEEAARLSESIDWTTTMVVPIPTDLANVQEVTVDGSTGLLLTANPYESPEDTGTWYHPRAMMWEKDGILYMIAADNLSQTEIFEVVSSIQ